MVTTYLQTLRLFGRNLRLYLVTAALVGLAWDGMRAVLLNLYLLRLGYGPESVGVINAVGALAFALWCPLAGTMGTRWGIRNMLIAGVSLLTAGFLLVPLAEFIMGAWRMVWLLSTSVLTYLGLALYLVNGLPFMMDATGLKERNHAFSVHMALAPLAAVVGSLVAGMLPGVFANLLGSPLEEAAPYRYPLWLAAMLLVPGILALLVTRSEEDQHPPTSAPSAPVAAASRAPYGLFLAIALIMALRFGGRGGVATFFNVYMDEGLGVSTALIGALTAAGQLLSVPAALAAPLLVARWGNVRTVFWGTMGMALCTLPLALVPQWAVAGVGFISSTAFFAMTTGPIRVFSQELVASGWRATMASAFMMGAGFAFSVASLVGGYAIMTLGYNLLFLVGAGLITAGGFLFWACFRVQRGETAHQALSDLGE